MKLQSILLVLLIQSAYILAEQSFDIPQSLCLALEKKYNESNEKLAQSYKKLQEAKDCLNNCKWPEIPQPFKYLEPIYLPKKYVEERKKHNEAPDRYRAAYAEYDQHYNEWQKNTSDCKQISFCKIAIANTFEENRKKYEHAKEKKIKTKRDYKVASFNAYHSLMMPNEKEAKKREREAAEAYHQAREEYKSGGR
jgi:hypothetical protein